jgi:16S rRNA (guanine966-N2)-methyltransferase
MRIISGVHKGRKLVAPKKLPVRPTTDRSKEGLFNILQHQLEFSELRVLDLFSGTGSISYEFASRGVKELTAVDKNRNCVHFIQNTAALLSINLHVVQKDCFAFLEETHAQYDLIFADPPYAFEFEVYESLLVLAQQRVKKDGLLIIEHFNKIELSGLSGYDSKRTYGSATFSFFKF